jgi:hypothetical protein
MLEEVHFDWESILDPLRRHYKAHPVVSQDKNFLLIFEEQRNNEAPSEHLH